VFEKIQRRKLPAHVSVKLTHLGLEASKEGCVQDVLKLAGARPRKRARFLWIDHGGIAPTSTIRSRCTGAWKAEYKDVGLAMQAYLRRTPADLETLFPLSPTIRLVKGAYNEPAEVAFPSKKGCGRQLLQGSPERLLGEGAAPARSADLRNARRADDRSDSAGSQRKAGRPLRV